MEGGLVYPERQRCCVCRKFFDFEVILGRYCSRSCANLPEQPADILDWPRKCRVRRDGQWIPKAVYFSAAEAARLNGGHHYLCEPPDGCGMYHISHLPAPYSELTALAARKEK